MRLTRIPFLIIVFLCFPIIIPFCFGNVHISLSVDIHKGYQLIIRHGLIAYINNVTITGRLFNTTGNRGIPFQNVSIFYKEVSERIFYDSNFTWIFVSNVTTDDNGYFSYVWIPHNTGFRVLDEYEVIYQVQAVWVSENHTVTETRDVYVSSREYSPPPGPSPLELLRPYLVTGLILSAVVMLSLFIFKKFGKVIEIGANTKSGFKKAVYIVLVLAFILDVILLFFPWLATVALTTAIMFGLISFPLTIGFIVIVFFFSIFRFPDYLNGGNRLKTVISSMIIAWCGLIIFLLLLFFYYPLKPLLNLFFPSSQMSLYAPIAEFIIYLYISSSVILMLFLLLIVLSSKMKT